MAKALVADLRRIVGSRNVSDDEGEIERYSRDAFGFYRAVHAAQFLTGGAAVVVWPASTEQVSRVLGFADRRHVSIVPYGAGTGVMGAATASDGCIVLSLQRMDRIIAISSGDMTARVQAGAILEDIAGRAAESALLLGHDPWSRPIATVGGAISTDGVGYTAASHGSMGDQVLGLEVVLASGEIVRTKGVPGPSAGPSLDRLFIGSEGTLGVITEATVQLYPQPRERILRAISFPDFEAGFNAVSELFARGVRPAVVDYGDDLEAGEREATLYLALDGAEDDVQVQDRRAREICRVFGGRDEGHQDAQRFWQTRHASAHRYKRDMQQYSASGAASMDAVKRRFEYLHVALPVSRVLEYRRQSQRILSDRKLKVREWSIWGRPEFFSFLIEREEGDHDDSERMGEAVDQVLTLAQDMGGTMEYCHGVGIKLAHLLDREMGAGMTVLRRIKLALDPNGILNPGRLGGQSGVAL